MVKVVAIAATHELAEQPPSLFNAQDKEPQKNDKKPETQGSQKKPGQQKKSGTDWTTKSVEELLKSKKSLSKRLAEHVKKLAEYIQDPYKFDNREFLKKAQGNAERIQQIITSRIGHLNDEIAEFNLQIAEIIVELITRGL